uniref:LAGLIDADG endonuclease n=1 Tax=Fusarium asiaticum TaxID=282267 RepID=A0A6M5C435_FUSAS|nr:LAGLIDADG endonuclease [Fusarium asiaticum]UPX02658.1 LAGLIDADG endonuclease [Fusarium vorosii]QJT58170.1 LAGLIDADG endonuclease [Fusarium asiaticum]QJT58225.1 LAGLIDADG endonuclease [Fusarium asiaticum]QJT58280.1 LAGLIDADG endonuclease [Fusarium asiaticum]QJT58335.1 LAGLIDADG endonuclease [Fusarium asiaticum]
MFQLLRDKLSNSGEALKLLIPNLVELYRGGWTNYSCMVTSQKILEKGMGNRGSKSTVFVRKLYTVVKEQRVDGSCNGLVINPLLRCTLRGFERISWYGIPSNQILIKRYYTTNDSNTNIESEISTINKESFKLNPWFITGFTDGDGSFTISTSKKKSGTGWKIHPTFTIGLDIKDLDILIQFKAYFNAGKIYKSKRGIIYYTIGSTKDLLKHVLPHFDKYPLSSLKLKDYLVFKRILLLMQKGEHQSLSGLFKIFSERANLNKGLPKVVEEEYPDLKPAVIPELKIAPTINPDWLAGFITAEASFFISIYPSKDRKVGYAVSLVFSLSQHAKDLDLLKRIADSLECGIVRKHKSREAVELVITKSEDINQKLTPLLSKHTLSGVKLLDFERFQKASILINSKAHLTSEGIKLIKDIKDTMYNRGL